MRKCRCQVYYKPRHFVVIHSIMDCLPLLSGGQKHIHPAACLLPPTMSVLFRITRTQDLERTDRPLTQIRWTRWIQNRVIGFRGPLFVLLHYSHPNTDRPDNGPFLFFVKHVQTSFCVPVDGIIDAYIVVEMYSHPSHPGGPRTVILCPFYAGLKVVSSNAWMMMCGVSSYHARHHPYAQC